MVLELIEISELETSGLKMNSTLSSESEKVELKNWRVSKLSSQMTNDK